MTSKEATPSGWDPAGRTPALRYLQITGTRVKYIGVWRGGVDAGTAHTGAFTAPSQLAPGQRSPSSCPASLPVAHPALPAACHSVSPVVAPQGPATMTGTPPRCGPTTRCPPTALCTISRWTLSARAGARSCGSGRGGARAQVRAHRHDALLAVFTSISCSVGRRLPGSAGCGSRPVVREGGSRKCGLQPQPWHAGAHRQSAACLGHAVHCLGVRLEIRAQGPTPRSAPPPLPHVAAQLSSAVAFSGPLPDA